MLRSLHTWPALFAGLLVTFMALTGAILAVQPIIDVATSHAAGTGDVASLAAGISDNIANVQRVVRYANGELVAYALSDTGPVATIVDDSGLPVATYAPLGFFGFVTELHRSLVSGDNGRIVAGLAAAAMAVLSIGGAFLLAKRLGGWKRFFASAKGTLSQRLHVELSRVSVIVLGVMSLTGLWMSLSYFGLLGTAEATFAFPPESAGNAFMALGDMTVLKSVALSDLRELVLAAPGDAYDVLTLTTASGSGFIDQATGSWLEYTPNSVWDSIYQTVYTLHTGEGLWWYATLLGLGALSVPALFVTGGVVWLRRQLRRVRIAHNAPAQQADTIILVGSEGNSTWGFAKTLHAELTATGHRVHVAAMNQLSRRYRSARHLIVMTATYGDGKAPASATAFLDRLEKLQAQDGMTASVLGFGDKSFPAYCAYADQVAAAFADKGMRTLVSETRIDRQSAQSFADWGQKLGAALDQKTLTLHHVAELPRMHDMVLESRRDYGRDYQTPRAILRFRLVEKRNRLTRVFFGPSFRAGDLVGLVPPGSQVPRYYSLASSMRDGFIEICVSRQPGGLCSTWLCDLTPGDAVSGFFKSNPAFHAPRGRAPLILIGAGTGIAPLVGHMRDNAHRRKAYLYWGGRDPQSDFLFREELLGFRRDGRLAGARFAFSRAVKRRYVQDEVRDDADFLRESIQQGASVLICGGVDMAQGVISALDDVLAPLKLDAKALMEAGRLAEDVY